MELPSERAIRLAAMDSQKAANAERAAWEEIERLREALRFYADETHYQPKKVWTTSMPQYEPDGYKLVTPVLADKGTRAKAAIAKATGGEK